MDPVPWESELFDNLATRTSKKITTRERESEREPRVCRVRMIIHSQNMPNVYSVAFGGHEVDTTRQDFKWFQGTMFLFPHRRHDPSHYY